MLTSRDDLSITLRDINDDFMLNTSPLVLSFLNKFIKLDLDELCRGTATDLISSNYVVLRKLLATTECGISNLDSSISVEWASLAQDWRSSTFSEWLGVRGTHVLIGGPFFWDDQEKGEGFVGIALGRDPSNLLAAAANFKSS